MARRVPEAGIVVGVLFASSWLAFVLLVEFDRILTDPSRLLPVVAVAAALCYPFAAWGVHFDDDPAGTFPPGPVAATGAIAATVPVVAGFLGGAPLFGLVVALVVALPPAAYAVVYGDLLPPARATLAVGSVLSVGSVVAGVWVAQPYLAGVVALLTFFASVAVHDRADAPHLPAWLVFGGTATVAALVGGGSVALGRPVTVTLASMLVVGFGGAVGVRFLSVPSGR
ncbi:hypothetical protein [Haloarchaeobius sp. HRN-SO-5]|uniref:hypothetical protein n=1 Tax=Haloarchaeobius sp. HRN-SO-5 TaxID=3446118 RepID=UPI003EBD58D7